MSLAHDLSRVSISFLYDLIILNLSTFFRGSYDLSRFLFGTAERLFVLISQFSSLSVFFFV